MKIEEMAHILRASKGLTGKTVFIVVGSTAVLAQFRDLPEIMVRSREVDLYPRWAPELSEVIEGSLGSGSPFHVTFGYHADGIDENTAKLPVDWMDRSIRLENHPLLDGAVAICPEIHDLAVSKLAAFREKDREWVEAGIEVGMIKSAEVISLIRNMQNDFPDSELAIKWLEGRNHDTPGP